MTLPRPTAALLLTLTIVASTTAGAAQTDALPKVFTFDLADLARAKSRLAGNDAALRPALDQLVADADAALGKKPRSVMDKPHAGPSGDKHDYVSFGPYWWPDPEKPDGLPFVRRDGDRNYEQLAKGDNAALRETIEAASTLAIAHYFTGDGRYAAHASKLLRVWFLDETTRMNPNFQYAQAVPGRADSGRGIGLIDFRSMCELVDALGLLEGSEAWTAQDRTAMRKWMADYREWLRTSKHAADERGEANNHGSWMDAQEISLLLYLGDADAAREICRRFGGRRVAPQVEPDGRMPLEIARTDGFSYSVMNTRAMLTVARTADRVGVDLWSFKTGDGRSIRKAVDYMLTFADPATQWPHNQKAEVDRALLIPILLHAERAWGPEAYAGPRRSLESAGLAAHRMNLLLAR